MTSAPGTESAERLMAGSSKTFYRAARFLPRSTRGQVIGLYAFCRRVDDLADDPREPASDRRRALEALASALEHGNVPEQRDAGWQFATGGTLAGAATLLVRAAIGDLNQRQPQTEADLMTYAFGVAGTVGIMMAEVLGAEAAGYPAAVSLGMAMQLSNIVRDVTEDLGQGRVYLPATWVSADRVRGALLQAKAQDRPLVLEATRRVLVAAEALYQVAYDGLWSLPWRSRWSILAGAMCYREIGVQVGADIELSWRKRTVVSGWRKSLLIALAGLRLLLPRFWLPRFWAPLQSKRRPVHCGQVALAEMRGLGVPL